MRVNRHVRWSLWAGLIGTGAAASFIAVYGFAPSPTIYKVLASVDRLGMLVASSATALVFPGDRIAYGTFRAATFFDIVLVLATGIQAAFLGAAASLLLRRKPTAG